MSHTRVNTYMMYNVWTLYPNVVEIVINLLLAVIRPNLCKKKKGNHDLNNAGFYGFTVGKRSCVPPSHKFSFLMVRSPMR